MIEALDTIDIRRIWVLEEQALQGVRNINLCVFAMATLLG